MELLEYINKERRAYILPFMGTNALKLINKTIYEVYNSPELQLEAAKIMDEMFPADFIYAMDDGNLFCDVLGIPLLKPDYDFPSVSDHIIKDEEALNALKVPNPYKDGRMPVNLQSLKLVAESFEKPLFVSLQGPFTLAVQIAGATNVVRNIIKNPEFINKLLEFTGEVVLTYAKAIEKVGVKYISIAEPAAVMIDPKRFPELVGKNLKKIYSNLSCWKGLHICGNTTKLLEQFFTLGVDSISLDQIMDLTEVAKIVPPDVVIVGNIDPINVLGKMSPEEVEKETLKLIKSMEPYKNFLLAFGCTCLNDTPVENLKAVTRATVEHMV